VFASAVGSIEREGRGAVANGKRREKGGRKIDEIVEGLQDVDIKN
jgi:hypothetical protein